MGLFGWFKSSSKNKRNNKSGLKNAAHAKPGAGGKPKVVVDRLPSSKDKESALLPGRNGNNKQPRRAQQLSPTTTVGSLWVQYIFLSFMRDNDDDRERLRTCLMAYTHVPFLFFSVLYDSDMVLCLWKRQQWRFRIVVQRRYRQQFHLRL